MPSKPTRNQAKEAERRARALLSEAVTILGNVRQVLEPFEGYDSAHTLRMDVQDSLMRIRDGIMEELYKSFQGILLTLPAEYKVTIPEVHYSVRTVASSEKEARDLALTQIESESSHEYSHALTDEIKVERQD